jgi:hypothetical protein
LVYPALAADAVADAGPEPVADAAGATPEAVEVVAADYDIV